MDQFERTLSPVPRKVEPIAGDGYCLMNSVLKCLDVDYGVKVTFEESKELILDEIYSDVTRYAGFYTGNNREVINKQRCILKKV